MSTTRSRLAARRLSRGLYRERVSTDALADLVAWQEVLPPGGAFSHLTGALVRGWWAPPLPIDLPVFAGVCGTDPRPRRDGLLLCRHPRPVQSSELAGLRVAAPAEILLACARDLGLLDLVVLGDAALHVGDCTLDQLAAAADRHRWGAPALRRALPYLDERSESAWESLLRMLHVLCGVPVQPQYPVTDAAGTMRADLWIVGTNRVAEYDGAVHDGQRGKDLARSRRLNRLGMERYGYTAPDVLYGGASVLADADRALGRDHEPGRIRAWHRALAQSLFTVAGSTRVRAKWARQLARQHRAAS